jgi:hypothetical protein
MLRSGINFGKSRSILDATELDFPYHYQGPGAIVASVLHLALLQRARRPSRPCLSDDQVHLTTSRCPHRPAAHSLSTMTVGTEFGTAWLELTCYRLSGECKDFMVSYLKCLKANSSNNGQCRLESKQYLECRMDK